MADSDWEKMKGHAARDRQIPPRGDEYDEDMARRVDLSLAYEEHCEEFDPLLKKCKQMRAQQKCRLEFNSTLVQDPEDPFDMLVGGLGALVCMFLLTPECSGSQYSLCTPVPSQKLPDTGRLFDVSPARHNVRYDYDPPASFEGKKLVSPVLYLSSRCEDTTHLINSASAVHLSTPLHTCPCRCHSLRGTRVDRGSSIELSTQPGRNCIFVAAIQLAEMDMLHWQMWECLPDTFHPMLTSTQPALLVWARPLDEPSAAAELHFVVSLNL